jgi:hypothetical protein
MRVNNTTLKVITKLLKLDFLADVIRDDYGTAIKRWLPKNFQLMLTLGRPFTKSTYKLGKVLSKLAALLTICPIYLLCQY